MEYSKQKGILPTILFGIGSFIHIVFIGGSFFYIVPTLIYVFRARPLGAALVIAIEFMIAMVAFVWSIPLLIGSFFVNAFPDIGVAVDGIHCRVYGVVKTSIRWAEVTGIVQLRRGYSAITVSRRGWHLLNGLYSNKIYGDIVKSKYPVVLISPGIERRDELLQAVSMRLNRDSGGLKKTPEAR